MTRSWGLPLSLPHLTIFSSDSWIGSPLWCGKLSSWHCWGKWCQCLSRWQDLCTKIYRIGRSRSLNLCSMVEIFVVGEIRTIIYFFGSNYLGDELISFLLSLIFFTFSICSWYQWLCCKKWVKKFKSAQSDRGICVKINSKIRATREVMLMLAWVVRSIC